ncbi:MAG: DUF3127 domain-containing protein [Longimicrobiales bacterium]|nr:DUF3127 domain-containing protein [Longimicrobiales bacterium]
MDLKITGTVKQILPEQTGESRKGPWRKQEFILETGGNYPKQVCLMIWGDNIDQFAVQDGETLTAHIDIQSREYNGRWYTDIKAWRVERPEGQDGPPPAGDEPWPDEAPADVADGDGDDGLPF